MTSETTITPELFVLKYTHTVIWSLSILGP
jgi:hypothetical protein